MVYLRTSAGSFDTVKKDSELFSLYLSVKPWRVPPSSSGIGAYENEYIFSIRQLGLLGSYKKALLHAAF